MDSKQRQRSAGTGAPVGKAGKGLPGNEGKSPETSPRKTSNPLPPSQRRDSGGSRGSSPRQSVTERKYSAGSRKSSQGSLSPTRLSQTSLTGPWKDTGSPFDRKPPSARRVSPPSSSSSGQNRRASQQSTSSGKGKPFQKLSAEKVSPPPKSENQSMFLNVPEDHAEEIPLEPTEQQAKRVIRFSIDEGQGKGADENEREIDEDMVFFDPFDLPVITNTYRGRVRTRILRLVLYWLSVLFLIYVILCMLHIMQQGTTLMGRLLLSRLMQNSDITTSYLGAFAMGFLIASFFQSTPKAVLIVATLVLRRAMSMRMATIMVMGADLGADWTGTCIGTLVSWKRSIIRRSIAGGAILDVYHRLKILIILPLELATGAFSHLAGAMTSHLSSGTAEGQKTVMDVLKLSLNNTPCEKVSDAFNDFYMPSYLSYMILPLMKKLVLLREVPINLKSLSFEDGNPTLFSQEKTHSFVGWRFSDEAAGGLLATASLLFLIVCLMLLVRFLRSLLRDPFVQQMRIPFNADFPCRAQKPLALEFQATCTGLVVILVFSGFTILMERGVATITVLLPFLGVGMLSLDRFYPLALSTQLGNAILTYIMVYSSDMGFDCQRPMMIAAFHISYTVFNILLWYLLPWLRNAPLHGAKIMGRTMAAHLWLPPLYLAGMYLLMPTVFVALSLLVWEGEVALGLLLYMVVLTVIAINFAQAKMSDRLPEQLRTWESMGIPSVLLTFDTYESAFTKLRKMKVSPVSRESHHDEMAKTNVQVPSGVEHVMQRIKVLQLLQGDTSAFAENMAADGTAGKKNEV